MKRPEDCEHFNFQVEANIGRLVDNNNEKQVNAYMAEVRVHCTDCGLPFEWVGLTCGFRGDAPRVDTSAQELRAPIKPKGCALMPGIPGFDLRAN